MNISEFSRKYDLVSKTEIEKVAHLAFFYLCLNIKTEFNMLDVKNWFIGLNFSIPNLSRLNKKLKSSSLFIRGEQNNSYKLHAKQILKFETEMNELMIKTFEIESDGSILPESLLNKKKTYIQKFGKQINLSYSDNIFDGCAVLMRHMIEICLIHTYENLGIETQIKADPDKYKDLKSIIKDARTNPTLMLSKESRLCLDEFRTLGNLSAHKLYYNCTFEEINRVKQNFRLLIDELFNKAGIKVEK
jgi:hypothetical protein